MQPQLLSAVTGEVVVCPPHLVRAACELLSAEGAGRIAGAELKSLLLQSGHGSGTFDNLLIIASETCIEGAVLGLVQPGRAAFVWPPATRSTDPRLAAKLLTALSARLDAGDIVLSQALLDPADSAGELLLQTGGFEFEGTVLWLRHSVQSPLENGNPVAPPHCQWIPWSECECERFLAVFEATQVESLDCPRVQSIRPIRDTFASQRAAANDETLLWRVLQIDGVDAGICLAVDRPRSHSVELTYFGVCPGYRGRRLGRVLVERVIRVAHLAGRIAVTAAVREENKPAMAAYASLRFHEVRRWGLNLRINPRYSGSPLPAQETVG